MVITKLLHHAGINTNFELYEDLLMYRMGTVSSLVQSKIHRN